MPLIDQITTPLPELSDRLCVVVDSCLEAAVFLEHVRGSHLVLGTVLTHHVQLLLAHPSLRLSSVKEVLQGNGTATLVSE